jgi:hypothetical protein
MLRDDILPIRGQIEAVLKPDEARRIAANIAKVPDLLLGFESCGRA